MPNILDLRDDELQTAGNIMFLDMGLTSVTNLNHTRLLDIDPRGAHAQGDHLEVDYLIPYNECCLVGEITGRGDAGEVRNKFRRFGRHLNVLRNSDSNDAFWIALGVPNDQTRAFRNITTMRGFF